jgi:ribosomal protein S10
MLTGMVVDGQTAKPLAGVTIQNPARNTSTTSDKKGNFSIAAKVGDKVTFSYVGYKKHEQTVPLLFDKGSVFIEIFPLNYELPEFTISGLTQFQRDSIEMTRLYSRELNRTTSKVKFTANDNSAGFDGVIGAPVQKISRSYKRNKRFKKAFEETMESRYIDTRYTPELTTSLTGLKGDEVVTFMNAYPMEYQFARTASDLELQEWIRNNYKEYSGRRNHR